MKQNQIIEELVKYQDCLVPVIGDELFYVEDENCTLHEFILQCFEKDFPNVADEITEEERKLMCEGGYDGLTLLSHRYNVDNNYESKLLLSAKSQKVSHVHAYKKMG